MATKKVSEETAALSAELNKVIESGQGGQTDSREPQPEPEPEAPKAPVVQWDLGAYQLTYHKPYFEMDGERVFCGHEKAWGHESEKVAAACLRKAAREHGVELAG